jgi:hypothetical protein
MTVLRTFARLHLPLVMVGTPDGPLAITDTREGGLRRWDALTGEAAGGAVATLARSTRWLWPTGPMAVRASSLAAPMAWSGSGIR